MESAMESAVESSSSFPSWQGFGTGASVMNTWRDNDTSTMAYCFSVHLMLHPVLANISSWCAGPAVDAKRQEALEGMEGCANVGVLMQDGFAGTWSAPATPAGAAGYVGIVLAVLSLLRLVWRNGGRILGLVRSYPEEAVSPTFKGKILDAKAEQMRVLVQAACYMLIPVTAWSPWLDPKSNQGGMSRTVFVSAAQIFLAFLAMFPGAIYPRSLDAIYCTLALLIALVTYPFPFVSRGDSFSLLVLVNGLMMALTAVRRTTFTRLPLLVVVHLLFGLSSCSMILANDMIFGEAKPYFAGAQAFLVVVMTVAAPVLERKSRSLLYQLLELEELQELFSASQCLLRSCFDVVVELDAAGRVVGPGRELGTLLLREQAMEGASFVELLEGSTAQSAFAERLASPNMQALGLAENMQASLRDSLGNCLEVELMWFTFTRSREKHRMLGLRESAEVQRQEAAAEESVTVLVGHAEMDVAVSETSSVPETHSVSSGTAVEAGALVVVDTLSHGFPVLRLSASFRARVGPLRPGQPIIKALKRPQRFERWLVLALTSEPAPKDCRVTFKMPQGNVNACCRLLKSGSSEEDDEEEAAIFFYGIHAEAAFRGEAQGPLAMERSPGGSSSSLQASGHQRQTTAL